MNCEKIHDRMPDVATGLSELTAEESQHLASCKGCAERLAAMRATMALLDEWQTPEPSPYFDVRLQARLREEMARPQTGWLSWFRRPVLAAALTVLMGIGVGLFVTRTGSLQQPAEDKDVYADVGPGTAVNDLKALDADHDMYSDFELLDDLELQQDVTANP